MDGSERRRMQNREAQRRFRQRQNQRKAATDQTMQTPTSMETTEERSRRGSIATVDISPPDELVDQPSMEATTTNSLFSAAFDYYDMGICSPSLVDGIGFTSSSDRNCMCDSDPNFSLSSSLVLQVSPANTLSESNTDQSISALIASIRDSESSSTTRSEIVDDNGGVSDSAIGSFARECVTLVATCGIDDNGLTSTTSGSFSKTGEKSDGGWQNYLHIAATRGFDKIARVLLKHNIDCDEKDSDGLTPLIHATIGGHEDVVSSLLSHGATIAIVDSQYHRSALHWAIVHPRDSLLKILLEYCMAQQTAIDVCDNSGRTPLHMAVDTGYDAGVHLLLQCGANVQYKSKKLEPLALTRIEWEAPRR